MQRTAMYRQQPLHRQMTDCIVTADHILGVSHRNTLPYVMRKSLIINIFVRDCCALDFRDTHSLCLSLRQ